MRNVSIAIYNIMLCCRVPRVVEPDELLLVRHSSEFMKAPAANIVGALAVTQVRHFRITEAQQLRAWEATIAMLRPALAALPAAVGWHILLEYPMLRLGRRPDVILLTDSAIFVLEIKAGKIAHTPADGVKLKTMRSIL